MSTIYLDNNSTTRVADEVAAAMTPYWREQYGNASSLHRMGQAARHAIETARGEVAALIGAETRQIVFTSGGTEADNLAILGTLAAYPTKRHIVTTAVEHVAVHSLCERLANEGYRVTFVGVDTAGHLDVSALAAALDDDTAIVSVMHANNETGVIFPIAEVAKLTAAKGIPLHVDAVQTTGKLPLDVSALGAQLVSLSAHKIHGPKGVGGLWIRKGTPLAPQFVGGGQEFEKRAGTENVAGAVGLATAMKLATPGRMETLRDRLREGLGGVPVAGAAPHILNVAFEGVDGEALILALDAAGICVSSGSACASGSTKPSHVLTAMGFPADLVKSSVRFSLSELTTEEEIDRALAVVPGVVGRLRRISPVAP